MLVVLLNSLRIFEGTESDGSKGDESITRAEDYGVVMKSSPSGKAQWLIR